MAAEHNDLLGVGAAVELSEDVEGGNGAGVGGAHGEVDDDALAAVEHAAHHLGILHSDGSDGDLRDTRSVMLNCKASGVR